MGSLGWPEILLIAAVILVLFGAAKIPEFFEGVGKGVKIFKKEISEDEDDGAEGDSGDETEPPSPSGSGGENRPEA